MKALRITGRRAAAIAAAAATVAASLAFVAVNTAQAQTTSCLAVDSGVNVWSAGPGSGGFVHNITLANTCAEPVDGWTLRFLLPPGQTVQNNWSAIIQIVDDHVTFTPMSWNTVINPGASTSFGFIGSWEGTYQDPLSCTIDGAPCDGEVTNEPPEVTLTSPTDGGGTVSVCPVRLAADASDPDGSVDRVEFYVNDTLVGTDDEAPYGVEVGAGDPVLNINNNTAYARVFDDGSPVLSTDSAVVTFQHPVPPPVLALYACTPAVEVAEGGSATAIFSAGACAYESPVNLTIDGDAGVTVSPTSYIPSFDGFGDRVTVSAAPGTAGATAVLTATLTAEAGIVCERDVPITVVDGDPGANQAPEVAMVSPYDGAGIPSVCPVRVAAEASDPDGSVDRVEFYVNDTLVGTDEEAPYSVDIPAVDPGEGLNNTAFARAYDDGDPQLSSDSTVISFTRPVPPPAAQIIACTPEVDVTEGDSATAVFSGVTCPSSTQVELAVTGDAGITVSSTSFTTSFDGFGNSVTVSAALATAGATATLTATAPECLSADVAITVVDGDPGANQAPEVAMTSPIGLVGIIDPCGLTFTADAGDPDGAIDRVEFYVNGVLAGTDDTAPYAVNTRSYPTAPPGSTDNTASARAYDDGDPQLSTDSEPVTFQVAIGDLPPGVVFPCTGSVTLPAGSSEEILFAISPSTDIDELTLTVTGDPGVTVTSPAAPIASTGFRATVSTAAGSAGATATITATAEGVDPVTVSVTVA